MCLRRMTSRQKKMRRQLYPRRRCLLLHLPQNYLGEEEKARIVEINRIKEKRVFLQNYKGARCKCCISFDDLFCYAVKRRPGRPVGSVGPYKRKKFVLDSPISDYNSGEVRVSSRMSTSIFKHDITGASVALSTQAQENSPYVYPTAIRTSQLSGGKPPMSGFRKPYSKGYKKESTFDNIDPLTGKRRYTRRKKLMGDDRRDTFEDFSGESDVDTSEKAPTKFHLSDNGIWRPTDDLRLIVNLQAVTNYCCVRVGRNDEKNITRICVFLLLRSTHA